MGLARNGLRRFRPNWEQKQGRIEQFGLGDDSLVNDASRRLSTGWESTAMLLVLVCTLA